MLKKITDFINFWKYNTHPSKMEHKTRKLVLTGSNTALAKFNDSNFRKLANFKKLNETEHNRIFNELTVTNIVLIMLLLDQQLTELSNGLKKDYYTELRKTVPKFYSEMLRRMNIPENLAQTWDKLVILRYEEYEQEKIDIRSELLSSNDKRLKNFPTDNLMMIFQAVTLGLYRHIMRGNISPEDPLYKDLQYYMLGIYNMYLKML